MPVCFFSFFFLGVSIDALDRISFRVGYIIVTVVIALVFVRGLFFRHCFLPFYGCMDVGFNVSFVDWASIFSCTTLAWKDFLCVCCCLNPCCWGQAASGSRDKVPRTGGSCRHPMR